MSERMTDAELGAAVRRILAASDQGHGGFLELLGDPDGSCEVTTTRCVCHSERWPRVSGPTLDDAIRAALAAVEDHDDAD